MAEYRVKLYDFCNAKVSNKVLFLIVHEKFWCSHDVGISECRKHPAVRSTAQAHAHTQICH